MDMHTGFADRVDHRDDATMLDRAPRTDATITRFAKPQPTAIGSSWYHDAAIEAERQDAIDARSNPYH